MTIAEFLLARIAEDEALAHAASPGPWHVDDDYATVTSHPFKSAPDAYSRDRFAEDVDCWVIPESMDSGVGHTNLAHIARHDPARVLAECEAKRRIVGLVDSEELWDGDILRALAAVYADHPDYDEAWRP